MSDQTPASPQDRINAYLGESRSTAAQVEADHTRVRMLMPFNPQTCGVDTIEKTGDRLVCFSNTITPNPGTIALQNIIGIVEGEEAAIRACYAHARAILTPAAWSTLRGPFSYAPYEWYVETDGFDTAVGPHVIRIGFRRAAQIQVRVRQEIDGEDAGADEGPITKRHETGPEAGAIDPALEGVGAAAAA